MEEMALELAFGFGRDEADAEQGDVVGAMVKSP